MTKEEQFNNTLTNALNKANVKVDLNTIGILSEHTLHRVLKYYICDDESKHEIKIGKMFADVMIDNNIYEIQTKAFNAMRHKLDVFLNSYVVTICHAIAKSKRLFLLNDYGELISEKMSPKHQSPLEIMKELYKIKNYLLNPNLHFKIFVVEMDEFRLKVDKKRYHSKGFVRENQVPTKIVEIIDVYNKEDFKKLLNLNIPIPFDSKMFSKANKVNQKVATLALNILTHLDVVRRIGKNKNSFLYEFTKN